MLFGAIIGFIVWLVYYIALGVAVNYTNQTQFKGKEVYYIKTSKILVLLIICVGTGISIGYFVQ